MTKRSLLVIIVGMLKQFWQGLIDVVYPRVCLSCKRSLKNITSVENLVCCRCWDGLKRNIPPFCFSCGRHLDTGSNSNICPGCREKKLYFDRAFSPCAYEGAARELIRQFKYNRKEYLAPALSSLMVEFIREYNLPVAETDFIVPIPLHKSRLRQREFNQAEALAGIIAAKFNKPLLPHALGRLRRTKTQTGLKDNERFLNVKGSFAAPENMNLKGKNILLIDDVLTTGATSSEAAYALKRGGANKVFVLTLAN